MATISQPASKKERKAPKDGSRRNQGKQFQVLFALLVGGAILGCSAPGINQWYIAWFGVAPLLIAIALSGGARQAFVRGLMFGTAYYLVYGNWLLGLQPLDWLGFDGWQGWLLAIAAWIILSLHQGLITAIFAGVCRMIPMSGSFLAKKEKKRWAMPALVVIPLCWVLIHNIICNAHDALGIPWCMLEYSQYKQHNIIQVASAIGGVGIGFLIVMWNTALAALCLALWKKKNNILSVASREHAFYHVLYAALFLTCFLMLGFYLESQNKVVPRLTASLLQGNINIEMQRTRHSYTLPELWLHYRMLAQNVPPGLCVWSENALPTYLRLESVVEKDLAGMARQKRLNMVVGSMDQDTVGRPYNSAYGITDDGNVLAEIYHKRYLVPFGEYTPWLVQYFPEWIKRLTNTPAGGGFSAGHQPVVLRFGNATVAPLICFETLSPELVASSVRAGGHLLVNVSDLAWFHRSIVGEQMIAFSVLRAVENRRCFIFAANTGPSAIINADGDVQEKSRLDKPTVLIGKVGLNAKLTPFTRWFVF